MSIFHSKLDAWIEEHMPSQYAPGAEKVWYTMPFEQFARKWLGFLCPEFEEHSIVFSVPTIGRDDDQDTMTTVRVPNDLSVGLRWDGHGCSHDADPNGRSFIEYDLLFALSTLYKVSDGFALECAIVEVYPQNILKGETITYDAPEPIVHFPVPGEFIRSEDYQNLYGAVMFYTEAVRVRDAYLKMLTKCFELVQPEV